MTFGNGSNIVTMSLNLLAKQGSSEYCGILVSNVSGDVRVTNLLINLLNHCETIAKRLHEDKLPNEAHETLRKTLGNYLEINVKLRK